MMTEQGQLRQRLDRAEAVIDALRGEEVDAVVGRSGVALLRIREIEEQLRRSEARYRAIVETQVDLICRWTPDGTLTFVNAAYCDLVSRRADQLIGTRHELPVAPEHRERLAQHWASLDAQRPVAFIEHPVEVAGKVRWIQWTDHVITDREGGVLEVQSVGRDVTDRRVAENRLRETNATLERRVAKRTAQLERAQERERERLRRLLHDHLQQLLVAAKMRVDVAQLQIADQTVTATLHEVADLLMDSLQATRDLTAELRPPVLQEENLATLLDWLAQWSERRHALRVTVEAPRELRVEHGQVRVALFDAIRELLFNVVKHAQVDEAVIRAHAHDDGMLRVCVEDHGQGFDPDAVVQNFGLVSIRDQIAAVGGSLAIDARPGGGTTVSLHVPLAAAS